jgi:hypothetical protein
MGNSAVLVAIRAGPIRETTEHAITHRLCNDLPKLRQALDR